MTKPTPKRIDLKTIVEDMGLGINEAYPVYDEDIIGYLRDIEMFLHRLESKQNEIIERIQDEK